MAVQRRHERRARSVSLRWPERRTGFDRRGSYPVSGLVRSSDRRLAAVLAAIVLLGLLDWAFTAYSLSSLGAYEANPIMRRAFDASPAHALALKTASLAVVIPGIWWLRRYRSALLLALGAAALHLALVAYHVIGMTLLS